MQQLTTVAVSGQQSANLPSPKDLASWDAFEEWYQKQPQSVQALDEIGALRDVPLENPTAPPPTLAQIQSIFSQNQISYATATNNQARRFASSSVSFTTRTTTEQPQSLQAQLGTSPSQEKLNEAVTRTIADNDSLSLSNDLTALHKANVNTTAAFFVAVATLDETLATDTLSILMTNQANHPLCGEMMQATRLTSKELFDTIVSLANELSANQGFELVRLANETRAHDKINSSSDGLTKGIQRLDTINGADSSLGEELAGSDGYYSAAEIHAYLKEGHASYFADDRNQRLATVCKLIGRELASCNYGASGDVQFKRAGVLLNEFLKLSVDDPAGLLAGIFMLDQRTGIRLLQNTIDLTTNTKMLKGLRQNTEYILGKETAQALNAGLTKTAQGVWNPEAKTTAGVTDDIAATQVAMNRAGLAGKSGATTTITKGDVEAQQAELTDFLEKIPASVRGSLLEERRELRGLYTKMLAPETPKSGPEFLATQQKIGQLVMRFQIEAILGARGDTLAAVDSRINSSGMHELARTKMQGLRSSLEATYKFTEKARDAWTSGDFQKAKGILDAGATSIMLIHQSLEVEEALNVARDSGLMQMGYRNGLKPQRETLARLELAEEQLYLARLAIYHGANGANTKDFAAHRETVLKKSQIAYNDSIGRIKPTLSGEIRDAGWHMMMQDQMITEGVVFAGKFAATTTAMVGLFCLAGPLGAAAGASVGGALFGVGTVGATATAAIVGLGVESAIFLAGEKVIHEAETFVEEIALGRSVGDAYDQAAETVVYDSLEELGWDYTSTVVSLGVLKTFTHGAQVLQKSGLVSNEALAYGVGFLAEMTGMGVGQAGVESMQFSFGSEPVYVITDDGPKKVTCLGDIWNGEHLTENITGSFQTVLTYRIAGQMMKSGTEPISQAIHNRQVSAEIKIFEAQEAGFSERIKSETDIAKVEKQLLERAEVGAGLYRKSLESLYAQEQQAKTPEEKAALAKDIATIEKKLMEHEAFVYALHNSSKITTDVFKSPETEVEKHERVYADFLASELARGLSPEAAQHNARILAPRLDGKPGEARIISIDDAKLITARLAEAKAKGNQEQIDILTAANDGVMIADTSVPGVSTDYAGNKTRVEDGFVNPRSATPQNGQRTVDHHGQYAKKSDGSIDSRNSTMKLLDIMSEALENCGGDIDAAIARLNIKAATTDNLADGGWCVWIAKNQRRVLTDANLRALIREATHFEDFAAFGSTYYAGKRGTPGIELQAALFHEYNAILTKHGIKGSDRFLSSQAEGVLNDACVAIDKLLDPANVRNGTRRKAAENFWEGLEIARDQAQADALMQDVSVLEKVNFYDTTKFGSTPTLTQWLAVPLSHNLNLQVTVAPMPPVTLANGSSAQRTLPFVAIPDGRALPSGKGLLSVLHALNAAEKAKAESLGLTPNFWFGKDNVVLPNPAGGGTLLTPAELAKILTDPANGLFDQKNDTSKSHDEPSPLPNLTRHPNAPRYNLETGEFYDLPELTEMGPNAHYDEVPIPKFESKPTAEATGPMPTKPRSSVDLTPLSDRMWSTFTELHALIEGKNGAALTDTEYANLTEKLQSYRTMIDALSTKGYDAASLRSDWIILENEITKYDPATTVTESMPKPKKQTGPNKGIKWPTPSTDFTGDLLPPAPQATPNLSAQYRNLEQSPFIAVDSATGSVINNNSTRINLTKLQQAIEAGLLPDTRILTREDIIGIINEKIKDPSFDKYDLKKKTAIISGMEKFRDQLNENTILIQGIVPFECLGNHTTPLTTQEIRDIRLRSLQREPTHAYQITEFSFREGHIGLELEERGDLLGPIVRDKSGNAEFIDAKNQPWDIKKYFSGNETTEGSFNLQTTISDIGKELSSGENVILDCIDLTLKDAILLRDAIKAEGWSDRILWYPTKPE